jgi:hypothetical protein
MDVKAIAFIEQLGKLAEQCAAPLERIDSVRSRVSRIALQINSLDAASRRQPPPGTDGPAEKQLEGLASEFLKLVTHKQSALATLRTKTVQFKSVLMAYRTYVLAASFDEEVATAARQHIAEGEALLAYFQNAC